MGKKPTKKSAPTKVTPRFQLSYGISPVRIEIRKFAKDDATAMAPPTLQSPDTLPTTFRVYATVGGPGVSSLTGGTLNAHLYSTSYAFVAGAAPTADGGGTVSFKFAAVAMGPYVLRVQYDCDGDCPGTTMEVTVTGP
jgi:hypothetical protein